MHEPIRILHYIGSLDFGGSQTFVMEIYRKIDRDKIQFDFVTFPNEKKGFHDEIIKLGGKIYECPRYNGKNGFVFLKWWNEFFKGHKEYKVLHGHVRSVASLYIPVARRNGICTIVHSHSTSNGSGLRGTVKDIMQIPVRWEANYLFACSNEAGVWMYGKRAVSKKNYMVIPNAIDSAKFAYDIEKRCDVRIKLGIDDKFVIGTVGRLSEPKNHKFLIDVFFEVHNKNPKAVLLLVGDGDLRSTLEQQVKQLGIEDAVVFTGSSRNTQEYYQAMDIFAFPSLWEGLGIVALEAQCSGLRCVISERIPSSVDMKVGLIDVVNLNDKELWVEKLLGRNTCRSSHSDAVRKGGYDVTENARKLQQFYIKISGE